MRRWEYAELSNPAGGTDSVAFSHPQRPSLVDDYKAILQRGLKAENSNNRFLHLNLGHTSTITVAGLLGNEGWELVGQAALTGGHEYLMFKRELE
jgi:hypothetical protein